MRNVLWIKGHVLTDRDVELPSLVVADGRVTDASDPGGAEATTIEGWAIPGLVDAHCHVGLDAHGEVDRETSEAQILTDRAAGALLIRDAGSPADTRWIDEREDLPKLIRAGRHIARPRRYLRGFAEEIDPEELIATVRAQARAGDGWVKLVGDWIDRDLGDLAPCWPADVLTDAIAAAHEEGARVTAHCFGEDCLPDLLNAGIDCIEHGTGLTPEMTVLAAERGVAVVPTLINILTFPGIADQARERYPTYADHMLALHQTRYERIGAAHDAGVPLFVGTDAGGSLAHGLVAGEIDELTKAGVSPLDALDAACWAARRWLGRPGLAPGEDADLVVYPADPREDPAVLAHPTAVVLRGRVVTPS